MAMAGDLKSVVRWALENADKQKGTDGILSVGSLFF